MATKRAGSCRALIVEDDRVSRESLVKLLNNLGCECTSADSVATGLEQVASQPALVVLDLMLPDGNGSEILRHIRDRNLQSRVAVVSGVQDVGSLPDLLSLKPDAIFGKPLDMGDFVGWIQEDSGLSGAAGRAI